MKCNKHGRSVPSQVASGILVIAIGVLFLLANLDVIDLRRAVSFWPVAFIIVGAFIMFDGSSPNNRVEGVCVGVGNRVIGAVLIGVGVLMLLNRLGIVDVGWRTLWPVALIGVGGFVVYRAMKGPRLLDPATLKAAEPDYDSVVEATAIFGGFERRIVTPAFKGGEVTAIFGGCALDMRDSSIEGEAVLNVFTFCGGISIKCPPDWTVVLHGAPILGGFEEKTARPPNNAKRLIVTGNAIMGGVEVRN